MTSSEDRIMMYYINLIAESEKREKELQRSEEDRRRLRVGNPPGIDDRLAGLQKTRHEHNKKKKKKRTSSPSEVKSKKAKRKRPRQQPEASPVPSSSSGLGGLAADVVDDEELLIERRSTRNKFAIDDSPSLEEELHPKIVTISSGKLRDDRRPSKQTKEKRVKSSASRGRPREPFGDSSADGDPGGRRRRRLRVQSASNSDAEDDEGTRKRRRDSMEVEDIPDWALEGAIRRSSRIREARESSVVSDSSAAGNEVSTRRKRGRPKKSSSGRAKMSSSKKSQPRKSATRGVGGPKSTARKSAGGTRRVVEVYSSQPRKTGDFKIEVRTVAPRNSDIGFLRMEIDPKAGWSRSGIWRRRIGLEKIPAFPPLPLQPRCRDSFI